MKSRKAFTLIELLIVIAIIAILSAVFLPQLRGGQSKARDAARIAVVNDIVVAAEGLVDDNDGAILQSTGECFPPVGDANSASKALVGKMKAVPKTQKADLGNLCTGNAYFYRSFSKDQNKGYAVAVQVERKEAANVKNNDLTVQIKDVGGAGALVQNDLTKVVDLLGEPTYDASPFFYMVVK